MTKIKDIHELIDARKEMDRRIRDFVAEELEKFGTETGFSIRSVSIELVDITTHEDATRKYCIANVQSEVELLL